MNPLDTVIFFLPCIVCIIWLFIYCFRVKSLTQKMMTAMLILCTYYFTAYGFYIAPSTNYYIMAVLDMLNVPVVLTLVAVNLLFVYTHYSLSLYSSRWHLLLYLPVFILSTLNFFLYYIIGFDDIAHFYVAYDQYSSFPAEFNLPRYNWFHQVNTLLHNYVLLAYIGVTIFYCIKLARLQGYRLGDGFRFFFCGSTSTPTRVVCFLEATTLCLLIPLAGMGRSFIYNHSMLGGTLSVLMAVCLFCLFYVEYMIDLPEFTLRSLSHVQIVAPSTPKSSDTNIDEADIVDANTTGTSIAVSPTLVSAIRQAFDTDKVYLNPDLSIIQLAERLNTNRTTLSLAISQTYGMNFRQLVARYRIEEAKQYMLQNPSAKQEVVAMDCGFITAPAFNQKFKELTGDAPRIWLAKNGIDIS